MEPKPLKAADRPAPAAGKAGGVYIPPFKLAAMMREAKVRGLRACAGSFAVRLSTSHGWRAEQHVCQLSDWLPGVQQATGVGRLSTGIITYDEGARL